MSLLYDSISQFKSSLRVALHAVLRSRTHIEKKLKEKSEQARLLEEEVKGLREAGHREKQLRQQVEAENRKLRKQQSATKDGSVQLPEAGRPEGHQFDSALIAFCCELCKAVGFRGARRCLDLVQEWLGVPFKIPTRYAMRWWLMRNGIAVLKENTVDADDWIWQIDHSVQLGKMCALIVLGIRQSELPSGRALRREDMKPLAVIPTTTRTKEDVARALFDLEQKLGSPIAVVGDGATELREGVKTLEKDGKKTLWLDDIKHKGSNILKSLLTDDCRFKAFESALGRSIASVQQTELDHFLPPQKKTKCRFMNFGKLIDWAEMTMFHLKNPLARGNQGISPTRLNEKFGWLYDFAKDLDQWRECRDVISTTLAFTNSQGVYSGATATLQIELSAIHPTSKLSQQVMDRLVESCFANEKRLLDSPYAALRFPVSTEVLESSLAVFKTLQRHHIRGTFTSLLAVFPTLFQRLTPQQIFNRFRQISTKEAKQWLTQAGLSNSTQARKTAAYKAAAQFT